MAERAKVDCAVDSDARGNDAFQGRTEAVHRPSIHPGLADQPAAGIVELEHTFYSSKQAKPSSRCL